MSSYPHLSKTILLYFLSSFLIIRLVVSDIQVEYINQTCGYTNIVQKSIYETNRNLLLANLTSKASTTSFHESTAGDGDDKVYALFLCRGDVTPEVCSACIKAAAQNLVHNCTDQKVGYIWYAECMLRYSNQSFFSVVEDVPWFLHYYNMYFNVTDPATLNEVVKTTMNRLVNEAAFGSSAPTYATGEANISLYQNIYCLVQCTPDISGDGCYRCLQNAFSRYLGCCVGARRVQLFLPSCQMMYDTAPFYRLNTTTPPPQAPPRPPPSSSSGKDRNTSRKSVIIGITLTVSLLLLATSVSIFVIRKRKRKKASDYKKGESVEAINAVESLLYDFEIISNATDNFSDSNKLGQGGFGAVYGGMLPSGQKIAVKRLSRSSRQGELEFKNEVMLVAKLQHRNLVRLLGFCLQGTERLLVYEFVANSSLDRFIFDPLKRAQLDWDTRSKIIGGVARGLMYLHEDSRLKIIHRDLKASNVLLDAEMNPKIADFGMAKLFELDETHGSTSRIVGTYGYMAPEYAIHGHLSVKTDVFSFGVLILEIVSGQRNSGFKMENEDLLTYAWRCWQEKKAEELIDPTLKVAPLQEIMKCIQIALLCVQQSAAERPTMVSVVVMLSTSSLTLPVPSGPAFLSGVFAEMPPLLFEEMENKTEYVSVDTASITETNPR